jgi:hypothetical protein
MMASIFFIAAALFSQGTTIDGFSTADAHRAMAKISQKSQRKVELLSAWQIY